MEGICKQRFSDQIICGSFYLIYFGTTMFSNMSGHFQIVVNRERQNFSAMTKRLELNLNTKLMAMEFLASDPEIKELEPKEVHNELTRPVKILKFFNVGVIDRQGKVIAEVGSNCLTPAVGDDVEKLNKVLMDKNNYGSLVYVTIIRILVCVCLYMAMMVM